MTNLADDKARSSLKPRSSAYRQKLARGVHLGLYVGARKRTWRGIVEGRPVLTIGDADALSYEVAAAKTREYAALSGADVDTATMTFGDIWSEYEKRAAATKTAAAVRTIRQHGKDVAALSDKVVATTPLASLNRWRDGLVNEKRGPVTANKITRSLIAALNAAGIDGPWRDLRQMQEGANEPAEAVVLNPEQLRELVAACHAECPAFGRLIEALALTGARPGEIRALQASRYRGGVLSLRTMKGRKARDRHIPLPSRAARWFDTHVSGRNGLAFVKSDGDPWGEHDLKRPLERAVARTDLPAGISPYTVRHSYVTAAIYANVPVFSLARQVGTSVAMIEKTYGHVIAQMQIDAFASLDDALGLGVDATQSKPN